MYYFMLVLSALLIGVAIYKKNPIVVSSEYREKPYSWFSICALSITSCLASLFILNPHIEMQSIPGDPVLSVYEHKANGLTMLWFLSEFYLFLVFAFFTLFKEVRNKYFIFFTDIISIAGICGSFSGILRYLDKLDYSGVSICAIAGVLILLSVFFSKKNSALTWLGNTNYLLIIGLGAYLAIGTDFFGTEHLPKGIKTYDNLIKRISTGLIKMGYTEKSIAKILFDNANMFFKKMA